MATVFEWEAHLQKLADRGVRALIAEIADAGLPVAETVEKVLAISTDTPSAATDELRPYLVSYRGLVATFQPPTSPLEMTERAIAAALRAAARL
jgi:hypothetical protein